MKSLCSIRTEVLMTFHPDSLCDNDEDVIFWYEGVPFDAHAEQVRVHMTEPDRRCDTCVAYKRELGECRALPPIVIGLGTVCQDAVGLRAVFPNVSGDDYCMMWKDIDRTKTVRYEYLK